MSNLIQTGDNADITKERRNATFDIHDMSLFLYGSEEILKRRKEMLAFVKSKPEFNDPIPTEFMNREQRVDNGARKIVAMTDNTDEIDAGDFFGEGMYFQGLIMGRDLHPMSLHYVMFLPTIQGQSDDEQLDEWLPLTISRSFVGTYAQTELGHGTNLSKLETTATYDPKTGEFVLHSPSITAAKWWPGGLGKSANVAIVVANLYTQGECKGPHPFFVQLRDYDTHEPLKGITVGDIGPKLGFNTSDNGFLLFNNFRIPRRNMLMKYAKVLPDGTYIKPQHAKLAFGTMVFVTEQLGEGNTELLPEIHALTSGLKSVVSYEVALGIEQCRMACGGHGYSQASAFPEIYAYAVAGCTYEGENIVMLLQVARFLMKAAEEVVNGKAKLADICAYLAKRGANKSRLRTADEYGGDVIIEDLEHVARNQVFRAYDSLKRKEKEMSSEEAWNKTAIELCKASRWHVRLYLAKNFLHKISTAKGAIREPLENLARLYAFDIITSSHGEFLRGGFMSEAQLDELKGGFYTLLERLRRNAVAIVDSWDFDDKELHSVLGKRDGNVYSSLLDWAQQSQLNRTQVLPTFNKYLGPMMKEGRSKL
ncbi:hypothetical protein WR25_15292 [Diploscapter pachys]|uniref:Acyl-coenzyme A oxidase n=1 Tax=Diploscapter pachys TaxID=2018661 RepID=A0A2A2KFS9_9BILA|nr:hypothetical protein WR25_15292 [Diploscapter pachys]